MSDFDELAVDVARDYCETCGRHMDGLVSCPACGECSCERPRLDNDGVCGVCGLSRDLSPAQLKQLTSALLEGAELEGGGRQRMRRINGRKRPVGGGR